MHPTKLVQPDESMQASAHILKLFLNNPLVKLLLPDSFPASTPAKELTALQIRLTSLETILTNLAKATTVVRKDIKALPTPSAQMAKPSPPTQKAASLSASYTAKAALPQRPSTVVNTAAYTWPENCQPSPTDICATINTYLDHSNPTQVCLSAVKWTPKGNLVFWGGPSTTAQQLTSALPHISEALQTSLSASAESAPQAPPQARPNIKWSKLQLNACPTGVTANRGAHTPEECHQALLAENPAYTSLSITQKPSWVRAPTAYQPGSFSSLSVLFEGPDSTISQALIRNRTLFTFRHVITVKK
ncbi:hypothetical protein BC827DRAFT_1271695 [Russula dissimulans]|nr:hypothetical protein BC827DRAFT_1271695 [Russula dissimulans]